jgi:hypothetical protein
MFQNSNFIKKSEFEELRREMAREALRGDSKNSDTGHRSLLTVPLNKNKNKMLSICSEYKNIQDEWRFVLSDVQSLEI